MAKLCPDGVVTYSTRIPFEPTIQGLRSMKNHVQRASLELSSEGICQIIAFCCTVGSMIGEVGSENSEKEIIDLMEKSANIPAITTTTAVKASLDALSVKRIAIATPYNKEINQYEKQGLERRGYYITKIMGYHEHVSPKELRNEMIGRLFPDIAYEMGFKVNGIENEAIFISCTNFRAIEIIQKLEEETGKPVISSNQAMIWYALRKLGIKDSIHGFGRLLERY
ncbi:MAG: maleate cis-trans isomerase [Thermodesulfobacteriota bacterium]